MEDFIKETTVQASRNRRGPGEGTLKTNTHNNVSQKL